MAPGHRNQLVHTFPSNGPDDALAEPIGHQSAQWNLLDADPERLDRFVQVARKDAVAIVNQELVRPSYPTASHAAAGDCLAMAKRKVT